MKSNWKLGAVLFCVVVLIAFQVGSYILTATFFGIVSLIGVIAVIESIPPAKWLAERMTTLIDVVLLVFTILATMYYGLNIAASLTVAGLGYTLVYAPYLRSKRKGKFKAKARPGNYKSKFDCR